MTTKHMLAAAILVLAGGAASSAFAHAKLQSSEPQAGSTLASAPRQVRLKFNEALEPAFSKIEVSGPQNREVALSALTVDKADPSTMTAQLPRLTAGAYRIHWTAMSHDGHKTKGDVPFTVK